MKYDSLSVRMKENYEFRARYYLPRRCYQILRCDGKAFHSYTKGFKRPFDKDLMDDMDATAIELCKNIQGAKMAYVQSDEISVIITDFDDIQTEAWFDNNIQKMASVSASIATSAFNQARMLRELSVFDLDKMTNDDVVEYFALMKQANFDSRVFSIADREEVFNYCIFRQQDATRNSVSMAAQSLFSHTQLQSKSNSQMQDMMFLEKQVNWNDYPVAFKRGRVIRQRQVEKTVTFVNKKTGEEEKVDAIRSEWFSDEPPVFTQDRLYLEGLIPKL